MKLLFLTIFFIFQEATCHDFNVDVSELRMNEIVNNINEMKVAIMGMAEYIQEINGNIVDVKAGLSQIEKASTAAAAVAGGEIRARVRRGLTVDELLKREELAQKIERLFSNDNHTKVDSVKQEMVTVVETNFIKMLAAVLLTGPVQAQERTPEILRLMKNVLNKQLDFKPIVDRLPFLIRNSETNQFILLLKALRDNERGYHVRQFGGLEDLGKVIDAAGKFDLKQVSLFLKELPELFESIETIVDGIDQYF